MVRSRVSWVVLVVLVSLTVASAARADAVSKETKKHARELFNKGVSEYNLGHYAEAGVAYEEAYRLMPDPALLYNAAQAQRLAGNRERAVDLYVGYLHTYEDQGGKKAEAEGFVAKLRAEIEAEKIAAQERARLVQAKQDAERLEATRREEARKDELARAQAVAIAASVPKKKPWYKRAVVWGVVGAVAGVGLAVGLGVGLGVKRNPVANMNVQVLP